MKMAPTNGSTRSMSKTRRLRCCRVSASVLLSVAEVAARVRCQRLGSSINGHRVGGTVNELPEFVQCR